jgi:pyroglutamyl-peptidase
MLLLTAFEPFDGTGLNSSQEVVKEFMRRHSEKMPVASAILPVEYDADFVAAWRVAEEVQPQAILHLGQAGREVIAVERRGRNLKWVYRGGQESSVPILDDAPSAYFATAPVDDLVSALTAAGIPAEASTEAGTYMCNHILFRSLHYAATQGLSVAIGFIHLPYLPEQVRASGSKTPQLPLATMVRGMEIAVEVILRTSAIRERRGP